MPFPSLTFTDYQGVIPAYWLNAVNEHCSNPEGIDATWDNITEATLNHGVTIEGLNIKDGAFTNALAPYYDFSTVTTPAYQKGRLFWDEQEQCLSYHGGTAGTINQVGRELWARCRNNSGNAITEGSAVVVTGAIGGYPTIRLATATTDSYLKTIGVATETIPNNSFGEVTTFGDVNGLNTSAWNEGDTLYLSNTPGQLTSTPPGAPSYGVSIGIVLRSHVNQGRINVRVQSATDPDVLDPDTLLDATLNGSERLSIKQAGSWWRTTTGAIKTWLQSNPFRVAVNDNTQAALTLVQEGTGNALLIEDSTSPDATPTVVDHAGRVVAGHTIGVQDADASNARVQVHGTAAADSRVDIFNWNNASSTAKLMFSKSYSGTVGSLATATPADVYLGEIGFNSATPAGWAKSAAIAAVTESLHSSTSAPAYLGFYTAAPGSTVFTERMRIGSQGQTSITSSSTSPALRVTQTGAGHSLLIEDSASPDSTPVAVTTGGQVLVGHTTTILDHDGAAAAIQVHGVENSTSRQTLASWRQVTAAPTLTFMHGGGNDVADYTAVPVSNELGRITFTGTTGTALRTGAAINAYSQAAWTDTSQPAFITLRTVPTGGVGTVERVRVRADGAVGIGTSGLDYANLYNGKNITGAALAYGVLQQGAIQPDVTSVRSIQSSDLISAGTALTEIRRFSANQGTVSGSVTTQVGYHADSGMIAGTTNYGFRSSIPAGTGRWAFYDAGGAGSYFGGTSGQVMLSGGPSAAPTWSDFLQNTATGTTSGGQGYTFKKITISEAQNATSGGAGKVDALQIEHTFGGTNARGGRHGLEVLCALTSATATDNPDRNYVGAAFVGRATVADNGTVGTPKGAVFGINPVVMLDATATNYMNASAAEINTNCVAGSSVWYKSGIQITQFATDAVQGSTYDAAVAISDQVGSVGWKNGILFGPMNGQHPISTNGTLIATTGEATARVGIDLRSYTFTDAAITSRGFSVTATGNLDLGLLGTAGTAQLAFHTGATLTQYDSRIYATGGTGTNGGGVLYIEAADLRLVGMATTTTAPAAGGAGALPATPAGYITVNINGTSRKVPYY